jgi:hypothetical protein
MHTLEVTSPIPAVGTSIPDTKAEPGGPHHAARFQSPTPPQIPANPRKSPQTPIDRRVCVPHGSLAGRLCSRPQCNDDAGERCFVPPPRAPALLTIVPLLRQPPRCTLDSTLRVVVKLPGPRSL